jgi:hypothetical protein
MISARLPCTRRGAVPVPPPSPSSSCRFKSGLPQGLKVHLPRGESEESRRRRRTEFTQLHSKSPNPKSSFALMTVMGTVDEHADDALVIDCGSLSSASAKRSAEVFGDDRDPCTFMTHSECSMRLDTKCSSHCWISLRGNCVVFRARPASRVNGTVSSNPESGCRCRAGQTRREAYGCPE